MDEKQGKTLDQTIVDCREHTLYCGVTMTGKTTLARHHARILSKAKHLVVVYDPVMTATAGGGWPDDAVIYNDPEKLDKFFEKAHGTDKNPVFLFVDESADLFNHSQTQNHWVPRRIRHQDIYLRLIAQRPKMLHPDVRSQCSYAYVLRLAQDDKKTIYSDFGHSGDVESKPLDKGDCVLLTSGSSEIEEFNVFELVDRKRKSPSKETP
jgi:hypothetical protein